MRLPKINNLPSLLITIIVGAISFFMGRLWPGPAFSAASTTSPLPSAIISRPLNQSLTLPIDPQNQGRGSLAYTLVSASLREEIIVKGARGRAAEGQRFLVVDLKLGNPTTQTLQINTRDYLRLESPASPEERLAPDLHNDPVEVQAMATKPTRLGFAVSADTRRFVLLLGRVGEEPTRIELDLQDQN